MQSARVYRSYLRKLQQQSQKSSLEHQRLEKASEELNDHTQNIASGFCNWVQSIGGHDPNCNTTEDAVLNWFAIGQDALEVEENEEKLKTGNDQKGANDQFVSRIVKPSNIKLSQNPAHQKNDKKRVLFDCNDSSDDMAEIEMKRVELENQLQGLTSTNLLNEFKSRTVIEPTV